MSLVLVLGVGLLGGGGAIARFLFDGAVANRAGREFPYGTLMVNLLGAFVVGLLVGAAVTQDVYRLVATGLVGSFTTFSTWAFESHRLGEDDELGLGILNFIVSLIFGLVAAWAGRQVGAGL